ncbi:hypothetical protein SNE25_13780 [Mucilaginibacter sabulilitoris]|uniref:Uncharacterized protein n=1 Tax=Mucilaginibacter sabulilitoris TaxID=1173583 RepID=A0ABZ0TXP5_9SPHI|nr:hypothetical protein [Mucilaginibacter sabulilitoris]WPU96589.1 hypothetical protein SNE25_13780 [Mucilaginibacter sabulilitoris]
MKYSEWRLLNDSERKSLGWHRHPRIKTVTLFTIAFIIIFVIVIFGISKNSTVHLNRKPTAQEAFNIAKVFVKDHLKQPSTAVFPNHTFKQAIDTAKNNYQIQSVVKALNISGKMVKSDWIVNMHYIGGDWSDKSSWQTDAVNISPEN